MDSRYLDILQAHTSRQGRLLLGSNLPSKLWRKVLILRELLAGKVTLREGLRNILPDSLKSKSALQNQEDLDARILFQTLFKDLPIEPLRLFDLRLYYLPSGGASLKEAYLRLFSVVAMIREIVLADQYSAGEFIRDGAVVIDAGANLGIFSLLAHYLAPHGKVYAFEPTSTTFELLQKNVSANHLSNQIMPCRAGLGNHLTHQKLMISRGILQTDNVLADSAFAQGREKLFVGTEEVAMTTIDSFVAQQQIPRVDFIKIDTEGYEARIIAGAEKTIKQFSPVIACSAYHLPTDKTLCPKIIQAINPRYQYRLDKKHEEVLTFWVNG